MVNIEKIQNWCFLGASRGLGKSSVLYWDQKVKGKNFYLVSRKLDQLTEIEKKIKNNQVKLIQADFNCRENQKELLENFKKLSCFAILYFAGGGPYGDFEEQKWKSHQWAYEVNFLFPSRLLYCLLKEGDCGLFTYVGSAIAENSADPKASSYAAAKHGMKGLLGSIRKENNGRSCDIRLFSPSYMDTEMLPKGAWPREKGIVLSTERAAAELYTWLVSNKDDFHRTIS